MSTGTRCALPELKAKPFWRSAQFGKVVLWPSFVRGKPVFYFWALLCPVPLCEFSGLFWGEYAPFIIQSGVLVKPQLTQLDIWLRSDIARNPLLKMSQKLKHQRRSKLLRMRCVLAVFGCCRKTSVRSVICMQLMLETWQHSLRMAAIPKGSWSRCDWRARCCRRWGSCKRY